MNFFIHFLKELKQTGAVAPSSRFLARNFAKPLREQSDANHSEPLNILEIGAGTGSLTKEIVKNMRSQDHLDIVELQEGFYKRIKDTFSEDNIFVHHTDILTFEPSVKYDFIFSSLPYENMNAELCNSIWSKKLSLCAPPAYITYFKYVTLWQMKNTYQKSLVQEYLYNKKVVLRNIPPAKVVTLRINRKM